MLTPFGITIRKQRLDKGMRLLDLAERLNMSSAYLSAVETGKKPIPDDLPSRAAVEMGLSAKEHRELQSAADQSRSTIRVDGLAPTKRELVAEFARTIEVMSPEDLAFFRRRIVHRSVEREEPFRRERRGLLVPPASYRALWGLADRVRDIFVGEDVVEFPIMEVVEFRLQAFFPGYYLDVCDYDEMGEDGGRVAAGQNYIQLRKDVYEGACRGHPRHRFTVCHELCHFLLHREITLARVRDDYHPVYRDAEWQADSFAGSLLMSRWHLHHFADEHEAARLCGMTPLAARVMRSKYAKEATNVAA